MFISPQNLGKNCKQQFFKRKTTSQIICGAGNGRSWFSPSLLTGFIIYQAHISDFIFYLFIFFRLFGPCFRLTVSYWEFHPSPVGTEPSSTWTSGRHSNHFLPVWILMLFTCGCSSVINASDNFTEISSEPTGSSCEFSLSAIRWTCVLSLQYKS